MISHFHSPAALLLRKGPGYPLDRRLCDPGAALDTSAKRKLCCIYKESFPIPRSSSSEHCHYIDWFIHGPILSVLFIQPPTSILASRVLTIQENFSVKVSFVRD
jgi:hypothetical protein